MRQNVLKFGSHLLAFTAGRTIGPVDRGLQRAGYAIPGSCSGSTLRARSRTPTTCGPAASRSSSGASSRTSARSVADNLNALFKKKGLGQLHAQTWKAEDGKHPTDVLIDDSLVRRSRRWRRWSTAHPGTFFVPKPSPKDRDWGCGDLPVQQKDNRLSHMTSNYTGKVVKDVMAQNVHPTVKPIELMRRLIRLVSKPGHTIIDPFMGSGTTGVAAILEGRNFIGIEREAEYFKIASTRIESAIAESPE
jgi:hypothetical protein